nr:growth-regulated protein homolog gamma-like [Columba livia]
MDDKGASKCWEFFKNTLLEAQKQFIPFKSGASRLPGSPLAGELRCRCVRTVSEVIPLRRLARVEFVAEGPHCAVPEVIATTKHGQTVCLSPFAPWVKLIVTRILNSSTQKN